METFGLFVICNALLISSLFLIVLGFAALILIVKVEMMDSDGSETGEDSDDE